MDISRSIFLSSKLVK